MAKNILYRALSVCIAVSFVCAPLPAQDDRNFGGKWVLNRGASDLAALPQPPRPLVVIEQQASTIKWSSVPDSGQPAPEIWIFNTDGSENRRQSGGTIVSSRTKWEGSALLTSTIVSTPGDNYTVMDHWRLSHDGAKLSIEREVVGKSGSHEGVLVYERERGSVVTQASPQSAPQVDTPVAVPAPAAPQQALVPRPEPAPVVSDPQPEATAPPEYVVKEGTRLPLRLINSVSTKHSALGDRVYLETVYPILSRGHIIIPPGSYVAGTLTEVKRAGRAKGKSEMFIRFDSLTLPNGTTRDFRARLSQSDANNKLGEEGKIQGDGRRGSDAKTVGVATAAGAGLGAAIGGAAGHLGMGAGIGAAAGALGGLAGILASRGPDAVLAKGTTVEMVLDRDLTFTAQDIQR